MKWMKWLMMLALGMVVAMGVTGCDDDDDGPENISGPAILRVVNQVQYEQEIRFDGRYIGDVRENSSRDWNVPEGQHTVTGHDDVTGDASTVDNFMAGRVTTITFRMNAGGGGAPGGTAPGNPPRAAAKTVAVSQE